MLLLTACGGPEPRKDTPAAAPAKKEPLPDRYHVRIETTKGDIVVEVRKEWSPRAAERFYELVNAHYYDGSKFHRVMRGFVAQFGIHPDPKMGALWRDLRFADEPVKLSNRRGTITFAHGGPHTRAVQVFFNLRDNAVLDRQGFPAFGKVVSGMDVADKLAFVYGELAPKGAGPDGTKAELEGNVYLERQFPRLDAVRKAAVVPAP